MNSSKMLMASALTALLVSLGPLVPTAFGQAPDHVQDVEKRLTEKRAAAETHRKQMEGIKDPDKLSVEVRRHFQMTEDMLALMLERKKLMEAHAPQGTSPAAPGKGGAAGKGQMGGGMQGGAMMQKEMGGMQGGMMEHGMMEHGMMEHGMMKKEMEGMKGGGMQGMSGQPQPQSSQAQPSDMDQMMQRLAEHSRSMETMQDRTTLAQEMLRHQKMLDQMLELMQR